MGKQRGLNEISGTLLLLAAACSSSASEQQRELLRGRDRSAELRAAAEKRRVVTEQGDLLPSESKAAGIVIPRGFTQALSVEHQWYFDGNLPRDKTEQYFTRRLSTQHTTRNVQLELEFNEAREKGDNAMKPAFVRIGVAPGGSGTTRIHVIEPEQAVATPLPNDQQVEQRLAESRKTAR